MIKKNGKLTILGSDHFGGTIAPSKQYKHTGRQAKQAYDKTDTHTERKNGKGTGKAYGAAPPPQRFSLQAGGEGLSIMIKRVGALPKIRAASGGEKGSLT